MNKKDAWIITFYAYKGGTGRTLALSNIARYLAEKKGYRVGLIDMDLESPGLPHEPLCSELEIGDKKNEQKRKVLLEKIDNQLGIVDLYLNLLKGGIDSLEIEKAVVPLPSNGNGNIILMPAGIGSVKKGNRYISNSNKLSSKISTLIQEEKRDSYAYLTDCLNEIINLYINTYQLDFVLIDGRTGSSLFQPIYTFSIPHALVLFLGLNEQNMEGSLNLLNMGYTKDAVTASPVFLVAGPVPTVGPSRLEDWLSKLKQKLRSLSDEREEKQLNYIYDLPKECEFMVPYSDIATYQETYFIGDFFHAQVSQVYINLSESLENLLKKSDISPLVVKSFESAKNFLEKNINEFENPIRIALENINYEFLKK